MKKLLPLFISVITLFLIAEPEPVKANVITPVTEKFLYLNPLLNSPALVIILLPIIIGLIFHRKFIAIWNFISMLGIILLTGLIIEKLLDPSLIIFALLYSSFFTMIAFISSSIGKRFQKINNLQEVFSRTSDTFRIIALFVMYLLLLSPTVYVANFRPSTYSRSLIIILGDIIALVVSAIIFYWIYKKSKSLPKKGLIFEKKDYLYFGLLLLIFIVSFVSGFF